MSVQASFDALLREPSIESFAASRKAVIESGAYDPYSPELDQRAAWLEDGREARFLERLTELFPNFLLSPRLHFMAAHAALRLGMNERGSFERALGALCLRCIEATGDAGEERPLSVLRVSDEYDVLAGRGLKLKLQSLVQRPPRSFDRITCAGGEVLWFDITDCFSVLRRRMGGA
jgi:hypothetical protein